MKGGDKILLTDIAAYIVMNAKNEDPLEIGARLARKLRMHSIEAESLFTAIYAAKTFGVPEDIQKNVKRTVPKYPFYDELRKILHVYYVIDDYVVNNSVITDYYEPVEDTVCFIWLAQDCFRNDVKKFEKLLDEFGILHRHDALIVKYHHNIRKTTVENILEALDLKPRDLPVLILSNKVTDKLNPETDNVVIIKGDFMNELLELPDESLRNLMEKFYIEISEGSNFKEIERNIKTYIKQEIEKLRGRISENTFNRLRELMKIGVVVITLVRTITLFYRP